MYSRQRAVARRTAGRLFLRIRGNRGFLHDESGVIEVNYAERYPLGQCIIAVTIPISRERLQKIIDISAAHQGYHYPPAVINGQRGKSLRLIWRFRNIKPNESERLLKYTKMVAEWAEKLFDMRAVVSPMRGLWDARWRLRALI